MVIRRSTDKSVITLLENVLRPSPDSTRISSFGMLIQMSKDGNQDASRALMYIRLEGTRALEMELKNGLLRKQWRIQER